MEEACTMQKSRGVDSTRNAIIEATSQLVSERGIRNVSVSAIAKAASINRKTFYKYFPDKYAVVNWLCQTRWLDQMRHYELEDGWLDVRSILMFFETNRKLYGPALANTGTNEFGSYFVDVFTVIIETIFSDAFERFGVPKQICRNACRELANSFRVGCVDWLTNYPDMDAASYYSILRNATRAFASGVWKREFADGTGESALANSSSVGLRMTPEVRAVIAQRVQQIEV